MGRKSMGEPLLPRELNKRLIVLPSNDPHERGTAIYVDPDDPRYEKYRTGDPDVSGAAS
jgi:hypothetical protein